MSKRQGEYAAVTHGTVWARRQRIMKKYAAIMG